MLSYFTSFLVNSPTLSSCSSSGILSSIRCWTISAILTTQPLPVQTRLLFGETKVTDVKFNSMYRKTVGNGADSLLHTCVEVVIRSLFRFRLQIVPSGNRGQSGGCYCRSHVRKSRWPTHGHHCLLMACSNQCVSNTLNTYITINK